MNKNIRCDVCDCKHNGDEYCNLDSIKITCGCDAEHCTCCMNYCSKE